MKLNMIILSLLCLFACGVNKNQKFSEEELKIKASLIQCKNPRGAANLNIIFYNTTARRYWIDPKNIVFYVASTSGRQPSADQISEELSRANQPYYLLPAHDSVSFTLISPSFGDYIFKIDSSYFLQAIHIPNYSKKRIENFNCLNKRVKSDTVLFRICK